MKTGDKVWIKQKEAHFDGPHTILSLNNGWVKLSNGKSYRAFYIHNTPEAAAEACFQELKRHKRHIKWLLKRHKKRRREATNG